MGRYAPPADQAGFVSAFDGLEAEQETLRAEGKPYTVLSIPGEADAYLEQHEAMLIQAYNLEKAAQTINCDINPQGLGCPGTSGIP